MRKTKASQWNLDQYKKTATSNAEFLLQADRDTKNVRPGNLVGIAVDFRGGMSDADRDAIRKQTHEILDEAAETASHPYIWGHNFGDSIHIEPVPAQREPLYIIAPQGMSFEQVERWQNYMRAAMERRDVFVFPFGTELSAMKKSDDAVAVVQCAHCGQWAARYCACKHCGAPVE